MGDQITNLNYLREFADNDNDEIASILQKFINNSPRAMFDIKKSIDKHDWNKVASVAHKFKSSVDFTGAKPLKELLNSIESNAKNQHGLEDLSTLYDDAKDLVDIVTEELAIELDKIR